MRENLHDDIVGCVFNLLENSEERSDSKPTKTWCWKSLLPIECLEKSHLAPCLLGCEFQRSIEFLVFATTLEEDEVAAERRILNNLHTADMRGNGHLNGNP